MSTPCTATFATYNVLNPFHSVKWSTQEGLNSSGKALSPSELKASTVAQDENAWRKYSNWDLRKKDVFSNIQLADIVCLQEVSRETLEALAELAPRYQVARVGYHSAGRAIQQFGNAIVYNTEKASLIHGFELRHGSGADERAAAGAVFKVADKIVAVVSVHLAGYNPRETDSVKLEESKKAGLLELQSYMEKLDECTGAVDAIVIAGDFNEDPGESASALYRPGFLDRSSFVCDGCLEATEQRTGRKIDWIYYKPMQRSAAATLSSMNLAAQQKVASDHLMTGTLVQWHG